MIRVRNAPDDLHREPNARADREGGSLSELIRHELTTDRRLARTAEGIGTIPVAAVPAD